MTNNKTQIVYIHGGQTFKNQKDYLSFLKNRKISLASRKRWSGEYLDKKLGKDFDIIHPRMPLQDYSRYRDWEIHFEKYIPLLRPNMILIGGSLGGIFLAKYLSEHKFPKKILALYLVCPPYDDTLPQDDLVGGFKLKPDLSLIEKNCKNINLLFSQNDDVVPVAHAAKYAKKLKSAKIVIYNHIPGHFLISEFPEIIKMIKRDAK